MSAQESFNEEFRAGIRKLCDELDPTGEFRQNWQDNESIHNTAHELYDVAMQTMKLIDDGVMICKDLGQLKTFSKYLYDLQGALVKAQGGHRELKKS